MALPFSMYGEHDRSEVLARPRLRRQLEANLAAAGLRPSELQRGRGGVAFVDLVNEGGTYGNLLEVLRRWTEASGAQWDVVRTKLRWVAITSRRAPSRHHRRWHQDADWVETLPRSAVVSIALDARVWDHFGNVQPKVEHSFTTRRWLDPGGPCRGEHALVALATAVQLHELGRTTACRQRLARHMTAEPTIAEAWLRALAGELRRPARPRRRQVQGRSIPRGAR